jgi:UDP-glucose 4-epimerase
MLVPSPSPQNVLVTGGAGFIGSATVEELVAQGHAVTVLDDLSAGSLANLDSVAGKFKLVQADICDPAALATAVAGCEVVVHLAAKPSVEESLKHPQETHRVTYGGTLAVAEAARQHGVKRIVFASSAAVYGDSAVCPVKESSPGSPQSPYGLDKTSAERLLLIYHRLYRLETLPLRFFNVYGRRQDPKSPYSGVISKFVDAAKGGQPVRINGDGLQTRDYVSVKDVARVIAEFVRAESVPSETVNVATGRASTLLDLVAALSSLVGHPVETCFGADRPGDIRHSVADVGLLKSVLGWVPETGLDQGLAELF